MFSPLLAAYSFIFLQRVPAGSRGDPRASSTSVVFSSDRHSSDNLTSPQPINTASVNQLIAQSTKKYVYLFTSFFVIVHHSIKNCCLIVFTELFEVHLQPVSQERVAQPELCRLLLDGRGRALQHTSKASANSKSYRPLQVQKPLPIL